MKKLVLLLVLTVLAENVVAQSFYNRRIDRKWIASGGTGVATYFGELKNDGDIFQGTRWNIEGGLERRITDRISVRANLTFFQVHGSDAKAADPGRITRNLNFTSWNTELAVTGVVQLFSERGRYYQRPVINPFLFAGIGAVYYNPRTDIPEQDHNGNSLADAGKMTSLRQHQTELVSYSPVALAIPFGLGVKMMITPALNFTATGGYRYTTTDYLDDVSTQHYDDSKFSTPLAAALADRGPEVDAALRPEGKIRGNPERNDGYFIFSLRVDYYLPSNIFGKSGSTQNRRYKAPKRREP
jgi:opacity protein-like surface antigen